MKVSSKAVKEAKALGLLAESRHWHDDSLVPESLRESLEALVVAGTPIVRLPPACADRCEECAECAFDLNLLHHAQASVRAMDEWQPGDRVAAWTGYSFDVLGVEGLGGGTHAYAQIEQEVLEVDPFGIIVGPSSRFAVLVPVERSRYSISGMGLYTGGSAILLPSEISGEGQSGSMRRWERGPRFGSRALGRPRISQALHSLAKSGYASEPSLYRDGGCLKPPIMNFAMGVAKELFEETHTGLLQAAHHAGNEIGSMLVGSPQYLLFAENLILDAVQVVPGAHDIGIARLLQSIQDGIARGCANPAPASERATLGDLGPCSNPSHRHRNRSA